MGWVKPIEDVEADFRRRGAFILFNPWKNTLVYFHMARDTTEIKRMMDSMQGRNGEMVRFLTARARGETK